MFAKFVKLNVKSDPVRWADCVGFDRIATVSYGLYYDDPEFTGPVRDAYVFLETDRGDHYVVSPRKDVGVADLAKYYADRGYTDGDACLVLA